MTRRFITDDFLLTCTTAVDLYERYAKGRPIIDFHSHLPVRRIAEDARFATMTELWLSGDHYKWRQMRTNGIDERYCTGEATDWEKFEAWARTVPALLGNPLYHWTHMELADPFGINDRLLDAGTAHDIWEECNEKLRLPEYSCRGLLRHFGVSVVCTTDDPVDSLQWHRAIAADSSFPVKVLPTFRPDKALAVEAADRFNAYVDKLEQAAEMSIATFDQLVAALRKRHDDFHAAGCRISDFGLETVLAKEFTGNEVTGAFARVRRGMDLDMGDALKLKSALLIALARMDGESGWAMQFHLGALRNNTTRLFARLGPDVGCDSIGDWEIARPLARFLDNMDKEGALPKTVIYNLNPRDNEVIATMIGNFQNGETPGKLQYGAAWWFLDNKSGIERQLDALANLGLLSRFVGMVTDSRSFLSFPRHDYFRRILCNWLGRAVEKGYLPADNDLIGEVVSDICGRNAAAYFGFGVDV